MTDNPQEHVQIQFILKPYRVMWVEIKVIVYVFNEKIGSSICKYLGAALKESKRIFDFDTF